MVFLITGCYLGNNIVSDDSKRVIKTIDIVKLIAFNLLCILARGFMLLIHLPLLNLLGKKKLKFKDMIVMTYAGIGGVNGLSLALIVAGNENLKDNQTFKIRCIFFVTGSIAFTVLVNSITIKYLMSSISYVKDSLLERKIKIIL